MDDTVGAAAAGGPGGHRELRYWIYWSDLAGCHKIWDIVLQAYCGFPGRDGIVRQLGFSTRDQARRWLQACEQHGLDLRVPAGWAPGGEGTRAMVIARHLAGGLAEHLRLRQR